MNARTLVLTTALFTAAVSPCLANSSHSYGFDIDDRLGWAIVSDDTHSNMSSIGDKDDLDDLKAEIDGEFLYIRQDHDRYVIRDKKLIARARESTRGLEKAGRELGEAVGQQVSAAMSDSRDSRKQARLIRRQSRISSQIARRVERGEDTDDLEQELKEIGRELAEIRESNHDRAEERQDRRDLEKRQREASRNLRDMVNQVNEDMLAILKDAMARGLAERVGDR